MHVKVSLNGKRAVGWLASDGYPSYEFFVYGLSGGVEFMFQTYEYKLLGLIGGPSEKQYIG